MALTLADLKERVVDPIDMSDYSIIDEAEVTKNINQGIKVVEAEIHNYYEDYYLDNADFSLVNGQRQYDLPSNIYADKIRQFMYDDSNGDEYPIKRIKTIRQAKYMDDTADQGNYDYGYIITNNLSNGRKIEIYPTPNENLSITDGIWFIRRAKQLSSDSDTLDIPEEFENVVILYAQTKCLKKDLSSSGRLLLTDYLDDYANEKKLMEDTLTTRQPDGDYNMELDVSFYEAFYGNGDYE